MKRIQTDCKPREKSMSVDEENTDGLNDIDTNPLSSATLEEIEKKGLNEMGTGVL